MAPSLWRKPGTKTFQLVHRSQRDPLINDPEASERVLKEIHKAPVRPPPLSSHFGITQLIELIFSPSDCRKLVEVVERSIQLTNQVIRILMHLKKFKNHLSKRMLVHMGFISTTTNMITCNIFDQ